MKRELILWDLKGYGITMQVYNTDSMLIRRYKYIKVTTSIISCILWMLCFYSLTKHIKYNLFLVIVCLLIVRTIFSCIKLFQHYSFHYSSTVIVNDKGKWKVTVKEKRDTLIRTIKFNKPIITIPTIMGKQIVSNYLIIDELTKKQTLKLNIMNIPSIYKEVSDAKN